MTTAEAATETTGPVPLTEGERVAFRMGVLHGLALTSEAIRPDEPKAADRLANLRIAIAGRSIDIEAPTCWPDKGVKR